MSLNRLWETSLCIYSLNDFSVWVEPEEESTSCLWEPLTTLKLLMVGLHHHTDGHEYGMVVWESIRVWLTEHLVLHFGVFVSVHHFPKPVFFYNF